MSSDAAHRALDLAARESYGRLLSFIAARAGGDLAAAEDALAEAFAAALAQWPSEGLPVCPTAWLLATARRRLIDSQRRGATRAAAVSDLQHAFAAAQSVVDAGDDFPDERLKLLFVCAHPAIDPASRTPLMLQAVLGLEAERIAPAFLTSPAAMSQRLVRAKAKIRAAGIPFVIPKTTELPERLSFVLEAIYAAYNADWQEALTGPTSDLAAEAIWLARVLTHLLPTDPEALGLLALLLHCETRRGARINAADDFVPLPEQDTARWNGDLMIEAETHLALAARHRRPGRFQLEAAIQSVHAQRARTGVTDWAAIALLYAALVRETPALGARIGQAIAIGQTHGAATGLDALDALHTAALAEHQPYWAARAHLLASASRAAEARVAYARAIGLTTDARVRRFLQSRVRALG